VSSQRGPGTEHREYKQEKSKVPQANMNLLVVGNARLASISPLDVFFDWKHWLKM
jgi:hypothetical protein